mmetsp:Transcript_79937/g.212162  ORF Transcript_79937/g.212162 Transcript_79937/m.212162 type:complete len:260 (-) Transcript_79937:39-818(-)
MTSRGEHRAMAPACRSRLQAMGTQDELSRPVRGVQVHQRHEDIQAVARQVHVLVEVPTVAVPGLPLSVAAVEISQGQHDSAEEQHGAVAEVFTHHAHPGARLSQLEEHGLVHAIPYVEASSISAHHLLKLFPIHCVVSYPLVNDPEDLADLAVDPLLHAAQRSLPQRLPDEAHAVLREGQGADRSVGGLGARRDARRSVGSGRGRGFAANLAAGLLARHWCLDVRTGRLLGGGLSRPLGQRHRCNGALSQALDGNAWFV